MNKLAIHLLYNMKLYMHLAGIASFVVLIHFMKSAHNMPVRAFDLITGLSMVFFIIELEYRFLFKKLVKTLKDQYGIEDN